MIGDCEKVGLRVAVIDASGKRFIGYGTYDGERHCGFYASERAADAVRYGHDEVAAAFLDPNNPLKFGYNPHITLDDGREIWGCECWWGSAADFVANGYAAQFGAPLEEK